MLVLVLHQMSSLTLVPLHRVTGLTWRQTFA